MAAVSPPGADGRLRPNEVKQIFEVAETSQGLLDAFFRVCSDYFPACVLLFFVGDDAIVRRTHGRSSSAVAIGARFSQDLSGALGPLRGGGELGAAAVTVEPNDALVVCGACTPGDALLLPLVVRSRTAAAVLGDSTISDADRRDLLSITTMASTALQSIIVRRSTSAAAVSEATRIMSAPIQEEEIAAERRRRMALVISAATAGVVLVGALYFVFGGSRGPTVVPLADIPGEPRVDVAALVPLARKASGLGDSADSVSLRATVAPDGTTNLLEPGLGADPWPARIVVAAGNDVAELEVDRGGMYPPQVRARGTGGETCGACGCDVPAPTPRCAVSKIVDAARGAGLGATERAVVTYAFCKSEGPRWTVAIPGRGEIRLSDATCAPLEQETLQAPPRKLDTIPGAPRVDAFALVEEARKQSGITGAVLVRIEAWFVGSDGLVDLVASGRQARVEWTFADPGDSAPKHVRRVVLDAAGMSVLSRDAVPSAKSVPSPTCTIATLWRSAIPSAPAGELAHVIYEADAAREGRGVWTIDLASSAVHQVRSDVVCAAWR